PVYSPPATEKRPATRPIIDCIPDSVGLSMRSRVHPAPGKATPPRPSNPHATPGNAKQSKLSSTKNGVTPDSGGQKQIEESRAPWKRRGRFASRADAGRHSLPDKCHGLPPSA